jgi:hypothetical protein
VPFQPSSSRRYSASQHRPCARTPLAPVYTEGRYFHSPSHTRHRHLELAGRLCFERRCAAASSRRRGHPVRLQAFPERAVPERQVTVKRRPKPSAVRLFLFPPWALLRRQLPPPVNRTRRRLLEDPRGPGHLSDHASSDPRHLIDLSPAPTCGQRALPRAAELSEPPPPSTPKMDSPCDRADPPSLSRRRSPAPATAPLLSRHRARLSCSVVGSQAQLACGLARCSPIGTVSSFNFQ